MYVYICINIFLVFLASSKASEKGLLSGFINGWFARGERVLGQKEPHFTFVCVVCVHFGELRVAGVSLCSASYPKV